MRRAGEFVGNRTINMWVAGDQGGGVAGHLRSFDDVGGPGTRHDSLPPTLSESWEQKITPSYE
jgi:hypothetical protein